MESFTKRRSWSSFTYAMTGLFLGCVGDLVPISAIWKLAIAVTGTIQYLHDGIYQADKACHEKFGMQSHRNWNIRGGTSFDPNEIAGPAGYGEGNYIQPVQAAVYTIFFENKDTASAPAQEIWITDTLDPKVFTFEEFSFQSVTIGDTTLNLLYGQKEFTADIDFRPARQLIGRVTGRLDTLTGVVSVYLSSLDPVTMQPNEDPALGILPPNQSAPEGEGSVSFTTGLTDLANGESFRNKAVITFDFNEPLHTNTWNNTIDDLPPQSRIESYDYDTQNHEIVMNISGNDNLAGIEYYMVYVSVNDSAFVPLKRTSDNTVSYEVTGDWNYKFYTIAVDSTGNTEEAPEEADLEFVATGIPGSTSCREMFRVYPNPANHILYIENDLAVEGTIELISVAGRVIRKIKITGTRESMDITGLENGLYFIRISSKRFSSMQKVIIEKR